MPITVSEHTLAPACIKARMLLYREADGRDSIQEVIRSNGYHVVVRNEIIQTPNELKSLPGVDIVLVDITSSSHKVLATVQALNAAIGICRVRPRLLCFSRAYRSPKFVLPIEKCGARYVRVESLSTLVEAIDLLLAEMNELDRNGPTFRIVHRFSQGSCAPGEEVSAVLLVHNGDFRQLPLAVVERLVFELLAQRRRIALDSLQIVSAMSGDWFFREHAANSGHKQIKRLRRATVKVIIQRIRDAMATTFGKANLCFDSHDVLRSCLAEGTNRVLYRLQADVRWRHELR